jgi:NAD(P)-dependent dehydrogenase (short-subunit alcohol dehydrogenase family)
MSRILITGHDGSLGNELMAQAARHGYNHAIGMPRFIYGKEHIDRFVDQMDAVDAVVLNDGTNHLSWIGETPGKDAEIMERNVMSPYWTLNALARKNKPCRVVFVTSQTYRVPQRTTSLYCASKAALTMLMRVAARELAPNGWVINAVAPGKIQDTFMSELTDKQVMELRGWSAEAEEYALKLIPAGRFTTRAEVAEVIYRTLALPSYVNGTTIEAMGAV